MKRSEIPYADRLKQIIDKRPRGTLLTGVSNFLADGDVKKERLEKRLAFSRRIEALTRTDGWEELVQIIKADLANIDKSIVEMSRKPVENEFNIVKLHGEKDGIIRHLATVEEIVRDIPIINGKLQKIEESSNAENLQESRLSA